MFLKYFPTASGSIFHLKLPYASLSLDILNYPVLVWALFLIFLAYVILLFVSNIISVAIPLSLLYDIQVLRLGLFFHSGILPPIWRYAYLVLSLSWVPVHTSACSLRPWAVHCVCGASLHPSRRGTPCFGLVDFQVVLVVW